MSIPILPPDANDRQSVSSISGDRIRLNLSTIRAVGISASEEIIREWEAGSALRSLESSIKRLSDEEANRQMLESFMRAGILDSMSGNRRRKFLLIPELFDKKARQKSVIVR